MRVMEGNRGDCGGDARADEADRVPALRDPDSEWLLEGDGEADQWACGVGRSTGKQGWARRSRRCSARGTREEGEGWIRHAGPGEQRGNALRGGGDGLTGGASLAERGKRARLREEQRRHVGPVGQRRKARTRCGLSTLTERRGERPSASDRARWLTSGAALLVGCECASRIGLERG